LGDFESIKNKRVEEIKLVCWQTRRAVSDILLPHFSQKVASFLFSVPQYRQYFFSIETEGLAINVS
jgi:hypothetical protein